MRRRWAVEIPTSFIVYPKNRMGKRRPAAFEEAHKGPERLLVRLLDFETTIQQDLKRCFDAFLSEIWLEELQLFSRSS